MRHEPTGAELERITGASAFVLCEEEKFNHVSVNLMDSHDFQTLIMNVCIILHMTIAIFH